MFCVDKIKYEHLVILSNLKSCQVAPRIVIFNLCICCQFEDSQIISRKIIPMSHRNIELWQNNEVSFFAGKCSLSFGTFRIFRKPNQELLYQNAFLCGLVLNGLMHEELICCYYRILDLFRTWVWKGHTAPQEVLYCLWFWCAIQ